MKKICKSTTIIAFLLALFIFLEASVNALQSVINTDQSVFEDDLSIESDEADSAVSNIIGEIEEERDEYSKTFRLENGNKLLVEYSVPIHYKDDQENWLNYDNTLKDDKKVVITQQNKKTESTTETRIPETMESEIDTDFYDSESISPETINADTFVEDNENQTIPTETKEFETESHVTEELIMPTAEISTYSTKNSCIDISYSKTSSENNMVFVGEDDNIVSWGYQDINSVSAKCVEDTNEYEGNEKYTVLKNLISTVKYDSVYKDVDMELISTSLGVKENIILNSKNAANCFISEYEIGKLTSKQLNDRVIALLNDKDEVEYYINAEYMYDAKGKVDYGLKLSIIEESNGKLIVELTADDEWLNNSERAFPVTIDPTFITGQQWNSVQCTYINSYYPNTAYGYGSSTGYTGTVYTGTYGYGMNRTLLKMNNFPSLNKGDMIIDVSANLYLYNGFAYSTGFFEDEYVGIYEVKESWSQSTVTWNSRPNFYSPLIDYVKFDESSEPGWFSMNITKAAKRWFQNPDTNYGIMLKSVDEDSCRQCAAYFSSNYPSTATPRPAFQITYRNNKGIEDYWSNTTINVGTAGTLYVNDYSGALTFTTHIASTASPAKTSSIEYVYNSFLAGEKLEDYTPYIGRGWRMNLFQTLYPSSKYGLTGESAQKYPYVFTDSDGTEHYFKKVTENNKTKYLDEDGLNLELTIKGSGNWSDNTLENDDYYVITDKDKNRITFFSDGSLRTEKDSYNQKSQQRYNAPDSDIKWVEDPSNNRITISQKNNNDYVTAYRDADNRIIR